MQQKEKTPTYFSSASTGELVLIDAVMPDYFEIKEGKKWVRPVFVSFFDAGSRKLLAVNAYLSESHENSVDIFNRFLVGNKFSCSAMRIRPSKSKAFLNLKCLLTEMNNRYAKPNGFVFIDDFAREGAPKDEAHLESSSRRFHSFEKRIISHFDSAIANQRMVKKKDAWNEITKDKVVMTRLDITLQQLNDSGLMAEYMATHNSKPHRFTEDGVQKRWIPNERWDEHLAKNGSFEFNESDFEENRVCGCK